MSKKYESTYPVSLVYALKMLPSALQALRPSFNPQKTNYCFKKFDINQIIYSLFFLLSPLYFELHHE